MTSDFPPVYIMKAITDQCAAGLTGGGPACPGCGERALVGLENDVRKQCRGCGRGWRVRVAGGGIQLQEVNIVGSEAVQCSR